jgi:hypothetical protein
MLGQLSETSRIGDQQLLCKHPSAQLIPAVRGWLPSYPGAIRLLRPLVTPEWSLRFTRGRRHVTGPPASRRVGLRPSVLSMSCQKEGGFVAGWARRSNLSRQISRLSW